MSLFAGRSRYGMVRDIAEGYIITNELTFKHFKAPEFQTFLFEADKLLREIRGNQPASDETDGIQKRQRKMQLTIANNLRAGRF